MKRIVAVSLVAIVLTVLIAAVASAQTEEQRQVMSDLLLTVIIVSLIFACIGIWSGYTDRAVFYHSMADAIISVLSIVGGLIVILIIQNSANNDKTMPITISCLIALSSLIYNGYMSFRYNSKFFGFCVLIGRMLMSALAFLVVFSRSGKRKDDPYEHHAVADTIVWMALVAGFAAFVYKLINKARIEDRAFEKAVRPVFRNNHI